MTCEIISHRGLCKKTADASRLGENTIQAFDLGVQMLEQLGHAKTIEFDVQTTKDDIPVIIHDISVDRTTTGKGLVKEYTFSELQKLDAGYGRKIPSLAETLQFFKYKNVTYNVELKERGIASAVRKIIFECGVQNKTIVSAFDYDDYDDPKEYAHYCSRWEDLYELKKELSIALLATEKKIQKMGQSEYIKTAKNAGAYAIHPEHSAVNKELVDKAHSLGLRVNVWTVNDFEVYKKLSSFGVDAIFCDNPSFLK